MKVHSGAASALALLPMLGLVLGLAPEAAADGERLANYFVCRLNDGKTRGDLMAFKSSYEKAVADARLDGYELRLQFPIYWGQFDGETFVWEGSWKDFAAMSRISTWFRGSEWPAKFDELMTCKDSSLWNVID